MNIEEVFAVRGLLEKKFPNYEKRIGQVQMASLIDSCIKDNACGIIEGSTGIGKSFAYLVPIILSGKKAIISTSNKSLQDQLNNKDLPSLKEILPMGFTWGVLKGKNNYFCHQRFKANEEEIISYFMDKIGMGKSQARLKVKEILSWAETTKDGDLEYYPKELPQPIKEMIGCDTRTYHERGSTYYNLCFARKAKDLCLTVDIILANHTLLALDMSLRQKTNNGSIILPKTDVIIIDEAHTFEKYVLMAFSDDISWYSLYHLLSWNIVKKSVPKKLLFSTLTSFKAQLLKYLPEKKDKYYEQKKVDSFGPFTKTINRVTEIMNIVKNDPDLNKDDETITKVNEVSREADNFIARLAVLSNADENSIRWVEARDMGKNDPIVHLKAVPLDISKLLKEQLFESNTVICTSATLTVNKRFDFFKYQLGMPDNCRELITDSPFNFKENCLIYISSGEQEKHYELSKLLNFSKGRAFVLFTSYKDMKYFYDIVETDYPKLIQDNGTSRVKLLEDFKKIPNAVLFATRSFWEGVDVQGDDLVLVVIHKLPFETPTDIVYSSKIEKIDEEFGKGSHWIKFTIPDMCLKLKQGVGRLIRSATDVGVIAVLDSRINFRNYGKAVLNSLPPAYRTQKLEKIKAFYLSKNR